MAACGTRRCQPAEEHCVIDSQSSCFWPDPDVVAQRLGEEIVLVHMNTDRIFVLNRTGARLWELLGQQLDRVAIQRRLLSEFDVDEAQLVDEVDELLRVLTEEQMIAPRDRA
jgi:ABC-type protease/lipase transport system fused ATPase/permease subunit